METSPFLSYVSPLSTQTSSLPSNLLPHPPPPSQPKLSEPAIATNHNKQALLSFWYNVCAECPENVRLVVQNPAVTNNIAFNYILADHDDQEVVLFNRGMLPAYYGILRLCCEQSQAFTRQLASHQNIQWAFKNLTPHASQYPGVSGGAVGVGVRVWGGDCWSVGDGGAGAVVGTGGPGSRPGRHFFMSRGGRTSIYKKIDKSVFCLIYHFTLWGIGILAPPSGSCRHLCLLRRCRAAFSVVCAAR